MSQSAAVQPTERQIGDPTEPDTAMELERAGLESLRLWAGGEQPGIDVHLLLGLSDLYAARGGASNDGRTLAQLMCGLIPRLDLSGRIELAWHLATLFEVSHDVVMRLAQDENADVAMPIIENSPVLDDADLGAITGMLIPERTIAVARRNDISPEVTDTLVRLGDAHVLKALVANPGARFGTIAFRQVAERAKSDAALRAELAERDDVPHAIASLLAPFLSPDHRKKLLPVEKADARSLLESLEVLTRTVRELTPTDADRLAAYEMRKNVQGGVIGLDRAVARFVENAQVAALTGLLSGLSQLRQRRVQAALEARDAHRLMVICHGMGLGEEGFAAIADLRTKRLGLTRAQADAERATFAGLDLAESISALQALQGAEPDSPPGHVLAGRQRA